MTAAATGMGMTEGLAAPATGSAKRWKQTSEKKQRQKRGGGRMAATNIGFTGVRDTMLYETTPAKSLDRVGMGWMMGMRGKCGETDAYVTVSGGGQNWPQKKRLHGTIACKSRSRGEGGEEFQECDAYSVILSASKHD